jgi:hypothetical protein
MMANKHELSAVAVVESSGVTSATTQRTPKTQRSDSHVTPDEPSPTYFSIPELAWRWRVSRSSVYNFLKGHAVVDFAPSPGKKGHKIVAADVVHKIERDRLRILR